MTVDQELIREAFLAMGLYGDPETGLLKRFGVILNASSTNYLVGREVDFINALGSQARPLAEKVLIDAGQWCANATFKGIMESPEWAEMVEPHVQNVKDRLEGLIAITNCLGWGRVVDYKLDEAAPSLEMTVNSSYYPARWIAKYGKSDRPICYMWTGVAGGYMDLLFGSKVNEFAAEEVSCAAQDGGNTCVFRARRLKKKFGLG